MNMLAPGAGFRNFQHRCASATAEDKLDTPAAAACMAKVAQARRYFDAVGTRTCWPAKTHLRHLGPWALPSRPPKGQSLTEVEV